MAASRSSKPEQSESDTITLWVIGVIVALCIALFVSWHYLQT
jgi:hypothetical protein